MAWGTCRYVGIGYHQSIDLDAPLYKFFSLYRFLQVVDKRELYFRNIEKWEDPWEMPARFFQTEGLNDFDALFFSKEKWHPTYASCFTEQFDTDALWRMYSPKGSSVCIETSARLILREMAVWKDRCSVYLAPVIYCNMSSSDPTEIFSRSKVEEYPSQFYMSFIKRNAFSFEKEMRIAIQETVSGNSLSQEGIKLGININHIIKRVILDPHLPTEEYKFYAKAISELGFPVQQSQLLQVGNFRGEDYLPKIKEVQFGSICGTKFSKYED